MCDILHSNIGEKQYIFQYIGKISRVNEWGLYIFLTKSWMHNIRFIETIQDK